MGTDGGRGPNRRRGEGSQTDMEERSFSSMGATAA